MNIKKYNTKIGKDLIKPASELEEDINWLLTGIPALDYTIGGGLPKGRMVSISGLQSHGKTSLAMFIIGQAQKEGINCAYVDAEHSFNPKYSESMGADLTKLLIITPDFAEEALDAIEMLIRDDQVSLVVIDSVPALSARSEAEGDFNQVTMALQARFMSRALRKLVSPVSQKNAIIIWINQLRQNIMGGGYGDPYIETGGMALKFYTSLALRLKRKKLLELDGKPVGYGIEVKVVKNKVGPPNGVAELNLLFGNGFEGKVNLIDIGIDKGIITRKGPSYFHGETNLGLGKDKAIEAITPELEKLIIG